MIDSITCAHCDQPIVFGQSYANVPVPSGELRAVHDYCMAGRSPPPQLKVVADVEPGLEPDSDAEPEKPTRMSRAELIDIAHRNHRLRKNGGRAVLQLLQPRAADPTMPENEPA